MLSCLALHHLRLRYAEFSKLRFEREEEFYAKATEAVLLQTGTRVEVYSLGEAEELLKVFSEKSGIPAGRLRGLFRHLRGAEAAGHLLRMACLLESRAMGESYLLWQVEAAASRAAGVLGELFSRALAAGRRAESMLSTDLHMEVYRRLGEAAHARRVTLYGAGRTGRELAALLAERGAEVTVAHRCADIARRCAAEVGGRWSTSVAEACRQAELLICATLASHVRLTPEMVGEGCVVADLSPFANVSPEVAEVAEVLGFEELLRRRMQEMRSSVPELEALVSRELEALPEELLRG